MFYWTTDQDQKINIGTEKTPNLANVGDYWDAATIDKIT